MEGRQGVTREGGERSEVGQRKVKNILDFCEKGSEFGKGIKVYLCSSNYYSTHVLIKI